MRTWQLAALGLLAAALAGCRANPEIAYLERDNRMKQDQIYRLRWRLEDMQDQLNASGAECASAATAGPEGGQPRPGPSGATPSTFTPRERTWGQGASGAPSEDQALPKTHIEMPERPESQLPERFRDSQQPSLKPPAGQGSWIAPAGEDSSRVAQITLKQSGIWHGRGGAEGAWVLVEPRDINGNLVAAPADMRIEVFQPGQPASATPVACWDFTARQTAGMLDADCGGGIHLDLPWPSGVPVDNHLRLLVRYTTRDGRRLQGQREVFATASARAAGWSAAEPSAGPTDQWHASPGGGAEREEAEPALLPSPPDSTPRRPVWSPERPL